MEKIEKVIGKVCKILNMVIALAVIVFLWLGWAGITKLYLLVILYATEYGIFYILSRAFDKREGAERRRAMRRSKEQFLSYVKGRYVRDNIILTGTAIIDIESYCKKNGIPKDDAEIKSVLDIFEQQLKANPYVVEYQIKIPGSEGKTNE